MKRLETVIRNVITYLKFWRILIFFLLIMAILTMVSRINDIKLLPQVKTESVKSMSLDHTVTIEGMISDNHKNAILLPKNLKIASVNISEGMYIKKGDELLLIDMMDLDDKISAADSEIRKQELQIQDKKSAISVTEKDNKITVHKSYENYIYVSNKDSISMQQKEKELNAIMNDLKSYKSNPLSMRDSTLLNNLKETYEEKKQAYNDTLTSKAEAIAVAERNLEDLQATSTDDDKLPLLKEQLYHILQELGLLTSIQQDNYYVRAGREGIIQTVNIYPGDTTGSNMAFLLYDMHSQINIAVFPEENLMVDSVLVDQNDFVRANDILYRINKQSLDNYIRELQSEADQRNIQISNGMLTVANQKSLAERIVKRAQADYERIAAQWHCKVDEADRQLQEANQAYQTYRDQPMDTDHMMQAYQNLQKEYDELEAAYDMAVLDSKNLVSTAESDLQNAQNTLVQDQNAAAVMEEDLKQLKRHIRDLKEIKSVKGIIRADSDGKVLTLGVTAGAVTGDDAAVLISDRTNGFQFTGLLPVTQSKYINIGDEIKLNSYHGNINIPDLTVTSIQTLSDNPDNYSVMVQIPEQEKNIDGNALLSVTKQTDTYQYCVPKEAVKSLDGKTYVYILSEKNTVLGIQATADKIEVTTLDQNDSYVAINAEFPNNAKIIVESNKTLKDNARVRSIDD